MALSYTLYTNRNFNKKYLVLNHNIEDTEPVDLYFKLNRCPYQATFSTEVKFVSIDSHDEYVLYHCKLYPDSYTKQVLIMFFDIMEDISMLDCEVKYEEIKADPLMMFLGNLIKTIDDKTEMLDNYAYQGMSELSEDVKNMWKNISYLTRD